MGCGDIGHTARFVRFADLAAKRAWQIQALRAAACVWSEWNMYVLKTKQRRHRAKCVVPKPVSPAVSSAGHTRLAVPDLELRQ